MSATTHAVLQRKCSCGKDADHGECETCKKKRKSAQLQRKAVSAYAPEYAPPIVHKVLNSPGQPLDPQTRAFMEPRFGHDFNQISIHSPSAGAISTKLSIGTSGDRYEQEADRIADRMISHPLADNNLSPIQRNSEHAANQNLQSGLGHDFSHVRVHLDPVAEQSARDLNAKAYTVGHHVVFGAGQYDPKTHEGKKLLAHELTHVVQQAQLPGKSRPLQRQAKCSLDHIKKECAGAAASCMTVDDYCKKKFPKSEDIAAHRKRGVDEANRLAATAPNAAANMLHFLGNTGAERTMPTEVFANHAETKSALMKHRSKFLEGVRKRLEKGTVKPNVLSEQIPWTDTADAFSYFKKDDLGYAVGGYTLCSKVKVIAKPMPGNQFEVTFAEWKIQAFDCYNWDPGKGVPGVDDKDLCCIENAGLAKHFEIRTDVWDNADADSMKSEVISAKVP